MYLHTVPRPRLPLPRCHMLQILEHIEIAATALHEAPAPSCQLRSRRPATVVPPSLPLLDPSCARNELKNDILSALLPCKAGHAQRVAVHLFAKRFSHFRHLSQACGRVCACFSRAATARFTWAHVQVLECVSDRERGRNPIVVPQCHRRAPRLTTRPKGSHG